MKTKIQIGTSGFGLAKDAYAKAFSVVEIQQTFYQPPRLSTLERWRKELPTDFEFTLKAWQLITHEARSPTYRRLKKKITEREKGEAGFFKSTAIVEEAWEATRACAEALRARTILFQCPGSFRQSRDNITNLEKFFTGIERKKLNLCWEPRGDWDPTVVKSICDDLDLSHVVDPFVSKSVTPGKCYFRLHGRNGWRYKYDDGELHELAAMVKATAKTRLAYVFFNNSDMTKDALRFQELLT
ncbi:MAG: DUF72 domain-containing protein [Acidobacteriota bacterium]